MSIHGIEPGLLLAAPRLGDPSFDGTVVLLGAHEEGGSIGWTVNGAVLGEAAQIVRATGLFAASEPLPAIFDQPAYSGGPVSPESVWLMYRRLEDTAPLPGSIEIGPDLAVTSSIDALRRLVEGGWPSEMRMFVGYAGWSPGQLESEVARGAWLPAAADADLLFDASIATMWERAYARTIGTIPAAFVGGTRGIS